MRHYPDCNIMILEGRVTADPERVYKFEGTPQEYPRTTFKIINHSVQENFKTGEWSRIDTPVLCRTYGEMADRAFEYVKKGRILLLQGRLKGERWEARGKYPYRVALVMVVKAFTQTDTLPRMNPFDPFEENLRMPTDEDTDTPGVNGSHQTGPNQS